MRLLELFSGTHSVGRVAKAMGYSVTSLDWDGNASITTDILKWDYKSVYPKGYFDVIWASPECATFSNLRRSNIGRKLKMFGDQPVTAKLLDTDMMNYGIPLLRKTEEIIAYFEPDRWFIENPQSSRMKDFIDSAPVTFDYCMYGFPYRKSTNIWSNVPLSPTRCDRSHLVEGKHSQAVGQKGGGVNGTKQTYRIPEPLIYQLLTTEKDKVCRKVHFPAEV